jgi:hypothetical protein
MTFWDFNETKNYCTIVVNNIPYKVLNQDNKHLVAIRLMEIKTLIDNITDQVRVFKSKGLPEPLNSMTTVFLSIHPNRYHVQEMQKYAKFVGLNKPKKVTLNYNLPQMGKDNFLKAQYRLIFFKIRKGSRIQTLNELVPLIIHEIAHTGCNHVTWRDDDHGRDFQLFEQFLYSCYGKL